MISFRPPTEVDIARVSPPEDTWLMDVLPTTDGLVNPHLVLFASPDGGSVGGWVSTPEMTSAEIAEIDARRAECGLGPLVKPGEMVCSFVLKPEYRGFFGAVKIALGM